MIPVALDTAVLAVAVAGRGPAALRRFLALRSGGARDPVVFADRPDPDLARAAGDALRNFLPRPADMAALHALWIAGLPDADAAQLAASARSARVLVNVEDRPTLCDFHNVAEVRHGDLLLSVSTGGASPRLAARIRARLADEYGPEWGDRLAQLRGHRAAWRGDGRSPAEVSALTDALLQANGWLA
jgi:precorrin-2 dehydrogenase / sirohydrochlorin ferrochelatase